MFSEAFLRVRSACQPSMLAGVLAAAMPFAAGATPLDQLVPGYGQRLTAAGLGGRLGLSLADAGDVNGDGYRDLLVGAPTLARGATAAVGGVYLVLGTSVGFPSADVAVGSATNVTRISSGSAAANASVGIAVTGVGDFNADGLADVAIGSAIGDFNQPVPGKVWIVYGRATLPATIDVDTDLATTTIVGSENGDGFGTALAGGGSINGDANPDLAIGAPFGHGLNGAAYVVFGGALPPATIQIAGLNGSNGITIVDNTFLDLAGISVAIGGDANGDGVGDLLVGAFGMADSQNNGVGGAYLVDGKAGGFAATPSVALANLTGTNGARFVGKFYSQSQADSAGSVVAFLRDMNGDGKDEIVIADPDASPHSRAFSGEVFVRFGQPSYQASESLAGLTSAQGFSLQGAKGGDKFGTEVATRSDYNNDGLDDFLIGASQSTESTPLGPGKVALVYGRRGFPAAVDLLSLEDRGFYGELFAGPAAANNVGSVAALCGPACTGRPFFAIGVASENSNDGAAYIVTGLDRIFFDGVDGN